MSGRESQFPGLSSRKQFFSLLDRRVRHAVERQAPIALLVVDIRRFSRINAMYGYAVGDRVLQEVNDTLQQVLREQDLMARIGDDQFAVILANIVNPGHAELAAFKIHRLLDIPVQLKYEKIRVGARIGIALAPTHARQAEQLLKVAEEALYRAKQSDDPIAVADTLDRDEISEDWDIELELINSIENSELQVHFQPKISLITGKPTGAEALVRWMSPSRGLVPPGVFLDVAESNGFIKPLTIWMLNSALRLSAEWTRQWGEMEVSVNIPTRLIEQPGFTDIVLSAKELWKQSGITLCLEVLEQSFISDVESCFATFKELQNADVKIAIDDFGTGYSSLSYFRDIPANELKIDRSFVSGLLSDQANANIVGTIIDLAHRFGLSVIAEGVEDKPTLDEIRRLNCDMVQGFYFAKPMPADEFNRWLLEFRAIKPLATHTGKEGD